MRYRTLKKGLLALDFDDAVRRVSNRVENGEIADSFRHGTPLPTGERGLDSLEPRNDRSGKRDRTRKGFVGACRRINGHRIASRFDRDAKAFLAAYAVGAAAIGRPQ